MAPRGTANAATTAADAVLRDLIGEGRDGRFPPELGTELGAWLTLHVARHQAQGPPLRWQWAYGLTALLLERAGLVELLNENREEGQAIIHSAGFGSTATRHHPITGWYRGRASCQPGCGFYGMGIATEPRQMHLQRALRPETLAMLDALTRAMEVDSETTRAAPPPRSLPPGRSTHRTPNSRPADERGAEETPAGDLGFGHPAAPWATRPGIPAGSPRLVSGVSSRDSLRRPTPSWDPAGAHRGLALPSRDR